MTPMRVLLVDDDEDIRLLVRLVLTSDNAFEVCGEAGNGQEAIALARTCRPDAIILDVTMPVMDGLTALPLLRYLCPTVPVIIFTAAGTDETHCTAMQRGASAVVDKRGPPQHLIEALLDAYAPVGAPAETSAVDTRAAADTGDCWPSSSTTANGQARVSAPSWGYAPGCRSPYSSCG